MTKKRKSLNNSFANEFVYGGDKPPEGTAPRLDVELEPQRSSTNQ